VLRLVPPLCLSAEDAEEVVERMDAALTKLT
jgi:4-aminobutyrate aminotransferase-like enzyme